MCSFAALQHSFAEIDHAFSSECTLCDLTTLFTPMFELCSFELLHDSAANVVGEHETCTVRDDEMMLALAERKLQQIEWKRIVRDWLDSRSADCRRCAHQNRLCAL